MSDSSSCEQIRVGRDKIASESHCGDSDLLKSLYDELTPKVTWVRGSREVGTGFFVRNGDELITNAHVATSNSSLTVVTSDGNSYPAYVEKYDDLHDLALLKIVGLDPDPKRAVVLANENEQTPATAYTLGHPGLSRLTISPGDNAGAGSQFEAMNKEMGEKDSGNLVTDTLAKLDSTQKKDFLEQINSKELWYSQYQQKGSSGSPQFNAQGRLIGVVHTGYEMPDGKKMTGSIPLSAVESLLSSDPGRFTFKYDFLPYVIRTPEGKIQAAVPAPVKEIDRNNASSGGGANSLPFFYSIGS